MDYLFSNRYYLCQRNNSVSGFTCQEFDTFAEADDFTKHGNGQPTTILYYSKLSPQFYDRIRLQRDVNKIFNRVEINNIVKNSDTNIN